MDFFILSTLFLMGLVNCEANLHKLVKVSSTSPPTGKEFSLNLNLTKAEKVLHHNVKVIKVRTGRSIYDDYQDEISFDPWTPSKIDLENAQNWRNPNPDLAKTRLDFHDDDAVVMNDAVNEGRFTSNPEIFGVTPFSFPSPLELDSNRRHDYIDVGVKLTPAPEKIQEEGTACDDRKSATVEVMLVCDKEFGDIFNHDRKRILDYWTVYFWDTPAGQPFIEEARANYGRADFNQILPLFSKWIYKQMGSVPKFDMAIAVTNTKVVWGGGLAYLRTTCNADHSSKRHWGTLVWNDDGTWGSVAVGAHEIAHSLGAPHDDDPKFPGGCTNVKGYVMSGSNNELKWFFSTCSDRLIGQFVRSQQASCLQRLDETTNKKPPIPVDFSGTDAPTMQEQCRRRLKNPKAFIPEKDTEDCNEMKCWAPNKTGRWFIWTLSPVDNSPCLGGGRCFRGRCRKIGKLLRNVGTGQCAQALKPFEFKALLGIVPCPSPVSGATPLEQFVVHDSSSNGMFLQTPWNTRDGKENGDKCLYTGNKEGDRLWTDKCDNKNSWQGWSIKYVGSNNGNNREFLLYHRVSKRCAKQVGNYMRVYSNCNNDDRHMRWTLV